MVGSKEIMGENSATYFLLGKGRKETERNKIVSCTEATTMRSKLKTRQRGINVLGVLKMAWSGLPYV